MIGKVYGKSTITKEPLKIEAITNTVAKLIQLANLDDNWDSYGAKKPDTVALIAATDLAHELFGGYTPIPDVFPVPNGNIQLEWSIYNLELEIEVKNGTSCSAYFHDLDTGVEWDRNFTYRLADLLEVIDILTKRNETENRPKVANG